MFQGWEIIIVLAVVLLFFGGKRIPELAKGLGQGIRSFKKGLKESEDDGEQPAKIAAEEEKEEPKALNS